LPVVPRASQLPSLGRSQQGNLPGCGADKREAEEKLLAELGPEAYKPAEIISPAQAEKTLGKKHPILGSLVETPEGKPTLAPESDKRPPLRQTAQEAFAA